MQSKGKLYERIDFSNIKMVQLGTPTPAEILKVFMEEWPHKKLTTRGTVVLPSSYGLDVQKLS